MKPLNNYSLLPHNSFALEVSTQKFYQVNKLTDLPELPNFMDLPFYILGEGSNSLFIEKFAPTILQINLTGISCEEIDDAYFITAAAGENWHKLVCYCLSQGFNGLENLALIPGSVGAAPVQNIGAYGVEFADICYAIEWFEFSTKKIISLNSSQCLFNYRDSIFKQSYKNKGFITSVTIRLPKKWQAKLSYQGLNDLGDVASAQQIFDRVVSLRQSKLPDPKILPNAGSFFKNPIVSAQCYQLLQQQFGDMPHYIQANNTIKLAAAWLIDQVGLKGFIKDRVGVHNKQALVLVNFKGGTGSDLIALAQVIQSHVFNKFKVLLEPEVRLISAQGEIEFNNIEHSYG